MLPSYNPIEYSPRVGLSKTRVTLSYDIATKGELSCKECVAGRYKDKVRLKFLACLRLSSKIDFD